jgi:hypothetical protein
MSRPVNPIHFPINVPKPVNPFHLRAERRHYIACAYVVALSFGVIVATVAAVNIF